MNIFQISLKAARVNANMTQEDVAKVLKRNKQTIVNWENGITGIHITDFKKLAEDANFNGLEKVKYILIDFEGFNIENNCLTPTMKIIRKKVEIKFKERIDKLYQSILKETQK